jgi:DHA3 family macrolide efflux protein-like MFS transporter
LVYLELLKKYKVLRQLSLLQIFAYCGAWFSHVAIYTMLVDFKASSLLIAFVVAMNFLPSILLSPFFGSILDRVNLKKLMLLLLFVEISMTLMFLTIGSLEDVYLLMVFIFIRMASASMFFTSEMTVLPKLLNEKILSKANEIHSIIWSFTFTAGMALGGLVVNSYGVQTAFVIDILFFIVAIVILLNIKLDIPIKNVSQNIFLDIKDGIDYIKKNPKLVHLILLHASVGFTSFDSLITLLADYEYKLIIAIPLAIGITNAVRALALMIGPLFITNWISKKNLYYLFIVQGITIFLWGITQGNFYISLLFVFMTGFVTTTLWSYTYAMLQEEVDEQYLGRVLSYNEMMFMFVNVVTTLSIGLLAYFISLNVITILLGGMFILTAWYYKSIILVFK